MNRASSLPPAGRGRPLLIAAIAGIGLGVVVVALLSCPLQVRQLRPKTIADNTVTTADDSLPTVRSDQDGIHREHTGDTEGVSASEQGAPPKTGATDSRRFLSELEPIEIIDVLGGREGIKRSVKIGGKTYSHSLWAQPVEDDGVSQITFSLKSHYKRLRGTSGIADASQNDTSAASAHARQITAVFRIYGDGNLLWESERLTGPGAVQKFDVTVRGLDTVALTAESASSWSPLVWVDAEVLVAEND